MNLANPTGLWLLAVVPFILLLHMYRVRRRVHRVTTLELWEAVDDRRGSPRPAWMRVRPSASLALQLLAVIAAALAIANPLWSTTEVGWPRVVMIVDTSASMSATDVPGGRFEAARGLAKDFAGTLDRGQSVMLMTSHGELLLPFTTDRERLLAALDTLVPTHLPGRISDALDAAARLAAGGPATRIHLFTDGAEAPPEAIPDTAPVWHLVGESFANAGITDFALRLDPAGEADYQLFVGIANFGDAERTIEFEVTFGDALLHRQSLTLSAEVRRGVVLPFKHDAAGLLTARISGDDALAADDAAHAVLPPPRTRRVVLIGEGDLFLEEALRSDGGSTLHRAPSAAAAHAAGADVVVIDGDAPEFLSPGRYLLIGSLPANAPIEAIGRIERPAITGWHQEHPVMRHVDLTDLLIEESLAVRRKEPASRGTVLAESNATPLMYAWDDGGNGDPWGSANNADARSGGNDLRDASDAGTERAGSRGAGVRTVFIGFRSLESDLRVRVAFPLLARNALEWLHPVRLDSSPVYFPTGAAIPGASPETGVLTGVHARLGIDGGAPQQIAVNLLDAAESDLAPGRVVPPSDSSASDPAPPAYDHQEPLWLTLALVALAAAAAELALYVYRRRRGASRLATALRFAALSAAAAALWQPHLPLTTQARHVVFAIDESASIGTDALHAAVAGVEAAATHAGVDDTIAIVAFSGNARAMPSGTGAADPGAPTPKPGTDMGSAPGPGAVPDPGPARDATDVALALRHAQALLPDAGDRRVVLLSDGHDTVSTATELIRNARRGGIPVHPVVIGGPVAGEVSVERVEVPFDVRRGEPFDVRIAVRAARDTEALFGLFRDGALVRSSPVRLLRGDNALVHREVMDQEGFGVFEARIDSGHDAVPGNNSAAGVVAVRSAVRVLLLDPEPVEADFLAGALRTHQIDVTVRSDPISLAPTLPAASAHGSEALADYDVVLLSNLSSLALTDAQMTALRDFVRDRGGGLVMLGGERSFGLGGYYRTPVEDALPVTMVARRKLDSPSTAVALVIDRSGSMNQADGEHHRLALAREAAQRAVSVMDQRTELGVLAFDMKSSWVVPIGPIADRQKVLDAIASMRAGGGGTQLMWGLRRAYRAIDRSPAVVRHVIILSDGEVYSSKFPELLGRMVKKNITVSAVTIGSETGKPQLRSISEMGRGRFYFTSDASKLPRIFTMETQLATGSGLVEESFRPVAKALHHEVARGIALDAAPALDGYVATTARAGADVLLESPDQEPVLAVWRFGLGRTAVFTSEIKPRWGARWIEWEALGPLFAQLVRWTAKSERRDDLAVHTGIDRDRVTMTVDAAGEDGRLVNFLHAQAGVVLPNRERRVVELRQSAPGRYQGSIAADDDPGAYLLAVSMRNDGGAGLALNDQPDGEPGTRDEAGGDLTTTASAVVSYSAEFRHRSPNLALLAALAADTGGQVIADAAEVFRLERERYAHPVPARGWLLAAALALLLLDLGARWRSERTAEENE